MQVNYDDFKITINGVDLPSPISMDFSVEDLDGNSYRDTKNAIMHKNRIRKDVHKISLAYSFSSVNEASVVLNAIDPETFSVQIYDVKSKKRITKKMYAGSRAYSYVKYDNLWVKALKFNLVEV